MVILHLLTVISDILGVAKPVKEIRPISQPSILLFDAFKVLPDTLNLTIDIVVG